MGGTAPETDVLIDVERVQFSNATIDVATLIEGTKLATARTDVTSVNEGASIRFQIQTTGFLEGETVSYSISGVADADIVGGRASNSVRVDAAGRAFVDVQLIADRLTEGNETLTFSVKNSSVNVTVVDTSVRPPTITESDDRIYGTTQNDLFDGRGGNDRITGASGSDTLIGGLGNDTLIGDDDADVLLGGVGNDFLSGGNGDDLLEGGAGQDELVGSAGRDTFVFRAVSESGLTASNADVIDNFVRGEDRIDLGAIDAFSATSSNDTFIWRGTASFSSTTGGEVSFQQFRSSGSVAAHTMIWIDTDQDAAVEMAIRLPGLHNLTEADFIL
jgi:Ca2+-binding RTX toxin-like protein